MCLEQVEILQGIIPGFIDDKLPVFIRVGQFLQKGRDPLPDAEILRHGLMKGIVLGINGDINMVVCDVDFKCFGFDGQGMSPYTDRGQFPAESLPEKPFKFKEI
jgi:hypothetical protein